MASCWVADDRTSDDGDADDGDVVMPVEEGDDIADPRRHRRPPLANPSGPFPAARVSVLSWPDHKYEQHLFPYAVADEPWEVGAQGAP